MTHDVRDRLREPLDTVLESTDSVEGFRRAFTRALGRPPSSPTGGSSWLPAPNGIHFHPPTSLWARAEEHRIDPPTGASWCDRC